MKFSHMIFAFFLSFLSASLLADQVCLRINPMDTAHPKHPNTAREVDDMNKSFHVYPDKKACFDLSKSYYMQYFMSENERVIIYGTKCRYNPKPSHEGAVLVYKGLSGASLCPVIDEQADEPRAFVASALTVQETTKQKRQAIRHSVHGFGFPRNFSSVKK